MRPLARILTRQALSLGDALSSSVVSASSTWNTAIFGLFKTATGLLIGVRRRTLYGNPNHWGFVRCRRGTQSSRFLRFPPQFGHSIEPPALTSVMPEEYIGFFFSREPVRLVDIIVEMVNTKVLQFLDGFLSVVETVAISPTSPCFDASLSSRHQYALFQPPIVQENCGSGGCSLFFQLLGEGLHASRNCPSVLACYRAPLWQQPRSASMQQHEQPQQPQQP